MKRRNRSTRNESAPAFASSRTIDNDKTRLSGSSLSREKTLNRNAACRDPFSSPFPAVFRREAIVNELVSTRRRCGTSASRNNDTAVSAVYWRGWLLLRRTPRLILHNEPIGRARMEIARNCRLRMQINAVAVGNFKLLLWWNHRVLWGSFCYDWRKNACE